MCDENDTFLILKCHYYDRQNRITCKANESILPYVHVHKIQGTAQLIWSSYTPCTVHTMHMLQPIRITILKICESRAHALLLYNCARRNFEHLAQCLCMRKHFVGIIHLLHRYLYFSGDIWCCFKLSKLTYLSHLNKRKSLCPVWTRLRTAYIYFMLENCDKVLFRFVHLTHQNLSARALFVTIHS